ncbi:hypothetical protein N9850_01490 [Granulosicoccus sp.]|nr:hypothetical protein [Granulosicoccus sp.]
MRHIKFYADDPLVKRTLGLSRLPDVSTVSRHLPTMNQRDVDNLQQLLFDGELDRLVYERLTLRWTLMLVGSVLGARLKAAPLDITDARRDNPVTTFCSGLLRKQGGALSAAPPRQFSGHQRS